MSEWRCPDCGMVYATNTLNDGRCGDVSRNPIVQCRGLLEPCSPFRKVTKRMKATVKIHMSTHGAVAISTNAGSEEAFLAALADEVSSSDLPSMSLIPAIVDICCKLRGYKANVTEHRVIVAGEWLPDDVVEVFSRPPAESEP